MKQLLMDTQARIASQVTAIKHVDEDWGQLDYFGEDAPVKWPCVLIDVNNAQWSNNGKLTQTGIVQVRLLVAKLKLTNSSSRAPQSQKDKAWEIFDLLEDVHKALHGYTANPAAGPYTRTSSRRIKRDDRIQLYEVIYSVQLQDASAMPPAMLVPKPTVKIVGV